MAKKSSITKEVQLKIINEYLTTDKSIADIAREYNVEHYKITNIMNSNNIKIKRKYHVKAKPVMCINTGKIYDSARIAALEYNSKNGNSSMILLNCKGITEQAHGVVWQFANENDRPEKISRTKYNNSYILNKLTKEQEQIIINMFNDREYITTIAKAVNCSANRVRATLKANGIDVQANTKRVKNIDTGEIYDSVASASSITGIKTDKIYNTCRGRLKKADGVRFKYMD